jgi:peptidoglycan hydrolase-like protein with peptidoglycan-binding domain
VVEPRPDAKSAPHAFQPAARPASPRNLTLGEHALEVQRRLAELGYLPTRPTGVWGPLSRRALRSFKDGNGLVADEVWDGDTEQALFASAAQAAPPFVGTWASDLKGCSGPRQSGLLHTVIESSGAKAGSASCAFKNKRQVGAAWNVDASCRDGRERWTANVQITVDKGRLTWTSERGTQSYIKCG